MPGTDIEHQDLANIRFLGTDSVDALWAENILPRFLYREICSVLEEWHRVLKPGGEISIECPDLVTLCREFLDGDDIDRYLTIDPIIWGFYGTQVKKKAKRTLFGCGLTKSYLKHALEHSGFEDFSEGEPQKKFYRSFVVKAKKK